MIKGFSVDTRVFRELGELLVGRDSTALIELVKNAYDADATHIVIKADGLNNPLRGEIVIQDDGVGMTEEQFRSGFLRIATRLKDEGSRCSPRFGRRYTGAKGIGRLAVHKLGRHITVQSVALDPITLIPVGGVTAQIDWDLVEQGDSVQDLPRGAIQIADLKPDPQSKGGTTITISRLRRMWTDTDRANFISEARSFRLPIYLDGPLPKVLVDKPLLFSTPTKKSGSSKTSDPGYELELFGDFEVGDSLAWDAWPQVSMWVVELTASPEDPEIHCVIAPTKRCMAQSPLATRKDFTVVHPAPKDGPYFQARILVQEGSPSDLSKVQRDWVKNNFGVRVFMEGFRVLPYGDAKDDWLGIDAFYSLRTRKLQESTTDPVLDADKNIGLKALRNKSYFGAVYLTQEGASDLRMLVNREGFVSSPSLQRLTECVRWAIELSTRVRSAVSLAAAAWPPDRMHGRAQEPHVRIARAVQNGTELAAKAQACVSRGQLEASLSHMKAIEEELRTIGAATEEAADGDAMIRVLASLGTQLSEFIHEVRNLLSEARTLERTIEELRNAAPKPMHSAINKISGRAGDVCRSLERQAAYLTDVVTPDARRRRSRQPIAERFDAACRLVIGHLAGRKIGLINEIEASVKSSPMFSSELIAVFSNLLTNAVKFAGSGGKIKATAKVKEDAILVRIQNTGARVKLDEAERWFLPFESSTTEVDAVLGQGMGLGLTITRRILEERGASISFVAPSAGFSTALEIVFPK